MEKSEIEKAFKERCRECTDEKCIYIDCAVYKYNNSKRELDPELTLKKYCKSCLNGNKFEDGCCSVNCSIYKLRTKYGV